MTRKGKEEHWAFATLRKKLSEKTQVITPSPDDFPEGEPIVLSITKMIDRESGTNSLFDPALKREINGFFYKILYPQILAVFENEPFVIPPIDKIEPRENRSKGASCNALFIINDPKRPGFSAESPWWYIRFDLEVKSAYEYFLQTELMLSLPFWLESDWALDFMIGARGWGNSPTLGTDRNELILKFSREKADIIIFPRTKSRCSPSLSKITCKSLNPLIGFLKVLKIVFSKVACFKPLLNFTEAINSLGRSQTGF